MAAEYKKPKLKAKKPKRAYKPRQKARPVMTFAVTPGEPVIIEITPELRRYLVSWHTHDKYLHIQADGKTVKHSAFYISAHSPRALCYSGKGVYASTFTDQDDHHSLGFASSGNLRIASNWTYVEGLQPRGSSAEFTQDEIEAAMDIMEGTI